MSVELPGDLPIVMDVPESRVAERLRELIALGLYREGFISAGKGAEMLGMSEREFAQRLQQHGLPYYTDLPDELENQVETVERLLRREALAL